MQNQQLRMEQFDEQVNLCLATYYCTVIITVIIILQYILLLLFYKINHKHRLSLSLSLAKFRQ